MALVAAPGQLLNMLSSPLWRVEHINKAPYSHTIQTDRISPPIKPRRGSNALGPLHRAGGRAAF